MLTKVQHVMEEMLFEILPFSGPVTLTLDYSEKDFTLRLEFAQEGCTEPVLEQIPDENIPLKLVQGMCSALRETEAGKILVEM